MGVRLIIMFYSFLRINSLLQDNQAHGGNLLNNGTIVRCDRRTSNRNSSTNCRTIDWFIYKGCSPVKIAFSRGKNSNCSSAENGSRCNCSLGFEGLHCQKPICINGVAQPDRNGAYTCQCDSGYTGLHCDRIHCSTHGTPQALKGVCKCKCHQHYEGHRCDLPICDHGRRKQGGQCQCHTLWRGRFCNQCASGYSKRSDKCMEIISNIYTSLQSSDPSDSTFSRPGGGRSSALGATVVFVLIILCFLLYAYAKSKEHVYSRQPFQWVIFSINRESQGGTASLNSLRRNRHYHAFSPWTMLGAPRRSRQSNSSPSLARTHGVHASRLNAEPEAATNALLPPSYSSIMISESPPPTYQEATKTDC